MPDAEQDRRDVWDYIAADNPGVAARLDKVYSDAAIRLAEYPKLGRPGKVAGTRELFHMRITVWCTRSTQKRCG